MRKLGKTIDFNGQRVQKGDTVATLSGDMTAKVYDIAEDLGADFVRLRPVHQPYRSGIWHAADQVLRIKVAAPK